MRTPDHAPTRLPATPAPTAAPTAALLVASALLALASPASATGAAGAAAWPLLVDLSADTSRVVVFPVDSPSPERDARVVPLAHAASLEGVFISPLLPTDIGGWAAPTADLLVALDPALVDDAQAAAHIAALLQPLVGVVSVSPGPGGFAGLHRVRCDTTRGERVLDAARALAHAPGVRFAEPDAVVQGRASSFPNDPLYDHQWALENDGGENALADIDVDAQDAWSITLGDPSVIVAVLDVGVQFNHPDLPGAIGADFTSAPPQVVGMPGNACDSHGTTVAGVINAKIDNYRNIAGLAPGVTVASARTFVSTAACDGTWTTRLSATAEALAWAQSIGARVTNNSNEYGFQSQPIAAAYEQTRDAGLVHVASAGNGFGGPVAYPASLPSVIAVSAVASDGAEAFFNNVGPEIALAGPGFDIATLDRTGYDGYVNGDDVFISGTSYASAYVAAAAALMLSVKPALTPDETEYALLMTAADLGTPGHDDVFGAGLLNAGMAVAAVVPSCPADYNGDTVAGDIFDLFDFLAVLDTGVDVDGDTVPSTIFDLFDFLAQLDTPCE